MNDYHIIQPPFTLKFREMSRKELRQYRQWFHEITPERIAELSRAVRGSPGYEGWEPDFMPDSLNQLGEWFAARVTTRQRTPEELNEIHSRSRFPIEISNLELTNETFSLAMDVGMYLAEVFIRNHPGLKWEQEFGGKRNIDFGQPVLTGFGIVPFNPVRMMVTLAYGLSDGQWVGRRLRETYEAWSLKVTEPA